MTKIQLRPLYPLFVLYSALNYNGYDKENNPAGMHPVRRYVRDYLNKIKIDKYDFVYHPYQYTKQVLTTDNLKPAKETNPDFLEALDYLTEFVKQSNLNIVWPKAEEETRKDLARYEPLIQKAFHEVDQRLAIDKPWTQIVFSVNLLESYKRGFSITQDKTTYLITGPSETPNISNFFHELIHSYLKDKKLDVKVEEEDEIYKKIPERLQKNYPRGTIIEESLARALTAYLETRTETIGDRKLSNQDKELIYPALFLKQLNKLAPKKLTMKILKRVAQKAL